MVTPTKHQATDFDHEHRVQATHEVFNQPPPLQGYNAYDSDRALKEAVHREGGEWGERRLQAYGRIAGGDLIRLGFEADENPPEPRVFDRDGRRIDEVVFHPAYHQSMEIAKAYRLHGLTWSDTRRGAQVVRSALFFLHGQVEAGTMCPIGMTHACIPALRHQPEIAQRWEPRVLSTEYDPRCRPPERKTSLTLGMAMTEKQGGSDVRANTTRAHPVGAAGPGGEYELVGHKWFLSAPMSDAFLALAHTQRGLCCFLLPKWRPDGTRNAIHLQRLKDKLGDQSNASSEVELVGAFGWMVGEEGRGVPTILEMVAQTRLDCILGSAALMRRAGVEAIHHCRHREAFGKRLIDQPLMGNVLADLALESEAAIALALRIARAFEGAAHGDEREKLLARLATPVGKYWICKRAPMQVNEAQECLGGAGYVEEFLLPRLYRQAPVNSIWEGPSNIQCLDVLRAMDRDPASVEVVLDELRAAQGVHGDYDTYLCRLQRWFDEPEDRELHARRLTESLALALQASILIRAGNETVADAFCAARLGGAAGRTFGTLPSGPAQATLIERAHTP